MGLKKSGKKEDLVERIILAFVNIDDDVSKAQVEELKVPPQQFRQAYEYLRRVNALYDLVQWDETAASDLAPRSASS